MNAATGTGTTLSNLFSGWHHERIAQVYFGPDAPDTGICQYSWCLQLDDVPFDRFVRGRLSALLRLTRDERASMARADRSIPGVSGASPTLRNCLSAWADLAAIRLSDEFWRWASRFTPDLLLANFGSIRQLRLAAEIAERLQVPIVPFFHDDWPTTMYARDPLTIVPRWVLGRQLRRCLRRALQGIGNSEAMAVEYSHRYSIPFSALTNCVNVEEYRPPAVGQGPLTFTYAGGLHLGRAEALAEVAEAIAASRAHGRRIRLCVHTPASDLDLLRSRLGRSVVVEIGDSVQGASLRAALCAADVLLHVESFDNAARAYTRLSFSTKLPSYLAAGRPILAYGPDDTASCRYVLDCGAGKHVSWRDTGLLVSAIDGLCSDSKLRENLGRNALLQAAKAHRAEHLRSRFRELLTRVAKQWRSLTPQSGTNAIG